MNDETPLTLDAWMKREHMGDTALAKLLDMDRSLVWRVRTGERPASPEFKMNFNRACGYAAAHELYPADFPLPQPEANP